MRKCIVVAASLFLLPVTTVLGEDIIPFTVEDYRGTLQGLLFDQTILVFTDTEVVVSASDYYVETSFRRLGDPRTTIAGRYERRLNAQSYETDPLGNAADTIEITTSKHSYRVHLREWGPRFRYHLQREAERHGAWFAVEESDFRVERSDWALRFRLPGGDELLLRRVATYTGLRPAPAPPPHADMLLTATSAEAAYEELYDRRMPAPMDLGGSTNGLVRSVREIDLTPAWVGSSILYQHVKRAEDGFRAEFRLFETVAGASRLVVGTRARSPAIVGPLVSHTDGMIYFTYLDASRSDIAAGVHRIAPLGAREVVTRGSADFFGPQAVELTLDGSHLLLHYPRIDPDQTVVGFTLYTIHNDLETALPNPDGRFDGRRAINATFSPDGRYVAYMVQGDDATTGSVLLVRPVSGGTERVVYESPEADLSVPPSELYLGGIGWDTQDRIVIGAGGNNESGAIVVELQR